MTKTTKEKRKKPEKHASSKEKEVFWYLNAKGEKLWGFRHRYYDALEKRREVPRQGFATETIAIRELLKVKTDLINGNVKKVDNTNLTVSEWLDIWYEQEKRGWEITTEELRRNVIKDQIKPLLGKYKLAKLDKATYIREFINVLLKDYAVGSVETYHSTFSIAVNAAVESEIIEKNRFTRIPLSKDDEDEAFENFLSPAELGEFLKLAKSKLRITGYTSTLILAYTGLRRGEMNALRWNDIDFEGKKLTVDETRDRHGVRSPKTKRSRRTIIISDILINQLKLYRKWCMELKFSRGEKLLDEDFILISRKGNPIYHFYINLAFDEIFDSSDVKRITPHGLRHTHATILLMSEKRIPVAVIAKRLGNTPQMINQIYGHVIAEVEEESVESFDNAISL